MSHKQTIRLSNYQKKIIEDFKSDHNISSSDAVRHFIDRGINAEKMISSLATIVMKNIYIQRRIVNENNEILMNDIDNEFEEIKEGLMDSLEKGEFYVGD